ncbi:hypothetical protein L1787_18675 [Acuticoccus sp. M5D2P5]|uniref:hypothetical protein n=1 Tax=Acuticoccus kalidii TaxID=2910977 RepID=UPI001F1A2749|nr:hypothetical protein [Acuticoccus kalidii]MCF3935419.1 hypothetical protein [Acuticoccus kalidii]
MRRYGLSGAILGCLVGGVGLPAPAFAEGITVTNRFVPPPAKQGYSYPDCYCRDSTGGRVEIGERACLTIGPRRMTARCDMSQNVPTWRMEAEGCPIM